MTINVGQVVTGLYEANESTVTIEDVRYDIVGESDDYIALFRPGRSVYQTQMGSEYLPARMFFFAITGRKITGKRLSIIHLMPLLDTPIRRR